jgi:two-component system, NtrC family, nitrogen regulation response regulator GlnG
MTRGRVLLLEDDVALRDLLTEALDSDGFEVRPCENFAEVRAAAAAKQADLVVADFWGGSQRNLPDSERHQIRELGSFLPVVLLTGRSWAAEVSAGELGAHALIRKPFDLDELLRTVKRVLAEPQA